MRDLFFDSSALVKHYVLEIGSAWVTRLLHPQSGNAIYLARVTEVEVTSALFRRVRAGSLSYAEAVKARVQFKRHMQYLFRVSELSPAIAGSAADLAAKHALRAYDVIQLATALTYHSLSSHSATPPFSLVSSDNALLTAAIAEGLAVDNPLDHP